MNARRSQRPWAGLTLALTSLLVALAVAPAAAADGLLNPPFFPAVNSETIDGRTLVWSELGAADGFPLFFAVGFPHAASTGAGALSPLDEFLRRENVRLIAFERTGATNRSTFDVDDTLDDYVADVERITALLGVERFSVLAFSAGGPGALAVAATFPERVRSVHLMAARGRYEDALAERTGEQADFEALIDDPLAYAPFYEFFPPPRVFLDPNDVAFLDANFGTEFVDFYFATAIEELDQNPEGLSASRAIGYQPWSFALGDVVAPVFVYQGWDDTSIKAEGYAQDTAARVGGASSVRFYPGESHFEAHLKHVDQVVLDLQTFGRRLILCVADGEGRRTEQVPVPRVARRLQEGATIGDCVWQ
ncbi:MAG: alpha/beta hydrolase [Pseudomonadota bacterium]